VSRALERRLEEALAGSELLARLRVFGESFLARRADDAAATRLEGGPLAGLARVLATSPLGARLVAGSPQFLERLAAADAASLARRGEALGRLAPDPAAGDLEGFLDALRVFRREETLFAACLDLGGVAPFPEVSVFLSRLAEASVACALARAQLAGGAAASVLSVLGMGKIGGREFTYHSDLDLIFLYEGAPEEVAAVSRVGQRLISYLTTMTAAGVAYAVDARLRPSGGQGMLVTSFGAFERYQRDQAETWEHAALMRARAIAGETEAAGALLGRIRAAVLERGLEPWAYLAEMRRRVERERGREGASQIAFKTGGGGLMDVDFLAAGAWLERGAHARPPALPSNPALLRAVVEGEGLERLLRAYQFLRLVEARLRWVSGRGVETLDPGSDALPIVAELTDPDLAPETLLLRIHQQRGIIREAFERVVRARTIEALAAG
jgi:glutamate-ammonia-ligase adenylyltransferase